MLKRNYWLDKQLSYMTVFQNSLPSLSKDAKKLKLVGEDEISRQLYLIMEKFLLTDRAQSLNLGLPNFQTHSQPVPEDKKKKKREDKKPDFLWSYVDYLAKKRRDFHIECKRLTDPKSKFCKAYVEEGVLRFVLKEWSYGLNCSVGLMVGYVQNLSVDECLTSIKKSTEENSIPVIKIVDDVNGITRLSHRFKRKNITYSPFELNHFWVKLDTV